MASRGQAWLYSPAADLCFIVGPAFAVTAAVLAFPGYFGRGAAVTPWAWLLLVIGVDVAHVYSTLFRTYLDAEARRRYATPLIAIPVTCWVAGVVLYSFGPMVFWRVLAYIAVFHFVRQQYGFLRLYSRQEQHAPWERRLEAAAIYLATLYPLIYWHTHKRAFRWFVSGDFVSVASPSAATATGWIYVAVLAGYGAAETRRWRRTRAFNIPKNLILLGTALSWYVGIVQSSGDLAFTVTNVVAHGVPYMALVWMYQRRQARAVAPVAVFVVSIVALAYIEEGFWDALVWREHLQFFAWLAVVPPVTGQALLAVLVPLLALPQATHYVLDGFIWRLRREPWVGKNFA